jgi:hypothetical protein
MTEIVRVPRYGELILLIRIPDSAREGETCQTERGGSGLGSRDGTGAIGVRGDRIVVDPHLLVGFGGRVPFRGQPIYDLHIYRVVLVLTSRSACRRGVEESGV